MNNMTETSKFLSILAKVMRNKGLSGENRNRDNYNKLYYLIHTELNSILQHSMYPDTSDIIQKTEDMLNAMESLYLCSEIIGKRCLCVSCHITPKVFEMCGSLMEDKKYISMFKKLYTQIPFIICDTDSTDSIEIVNYADIRITLSFKEFKFLIIESGRRKIALNKVVQFVIVHTKLFDPSLCIIADNVYSNAEELFSRVISGKLIYIDEERLNTIEKRKIGKDTSLLLNEKLFCDTLNDPRLKKYDKVTFNEIDSFVKKNVQPVLYGFWEEWISIETQIMEFYETQILQSQATLQEVVSDIVRIGSSNDRTLQTIRSWEENRKEKLDEEKNNLSGILKNIGELVTQICTELEDIYISEKKVSRKIFDNLFLSMFRCKSFTGGTGKQLLSRLYSYEYNDYELITAYIQSTKGICTRHDNVDIAIREWEKAKMLIAINDPDEIDVTTLKLYINALGKYCSTGKELYAKALTLPENEAQYVFPKSLNKGYMPAGDKLVDMYKRGWKINLKTLANSLVPEACMILAEKNIKGNPDRRHFVDLSDRRFTYYKIAAANQYAPAIGKIVDVVFESRFSSGFQIPLNEINNTKYKEMIENGHVICHLCHYLISKMYYSDHYSEILGVVQFSINENLSEAMNLLSNSQSALALYCKGCMYEFGGGVAIDLKEALKNYKSSMEKKASQLTKKRLEACREKVSRQEYTNHSTYYYRSNADYRSISLDNSPTTVSSGCFAPNTKILMADGSYCEVEKIKVGDHVTVFDHYIGTLHCEKIIANVHENSNEKNFDVINLLFDDHEMLSIVQSHALFDIDKNLYVWINKNNVNNYIGHHFACVKDGKTSSKLLINYNLLQRNTKYYMPISRYHLNVFAEGVLTMPPTKMTVNMFNCKENMVYNTDIVKQCGLTNYEEIKWLISKEEYDVLPCKFLKAICELKTLSIDDFMDAINLYREQEKYTVL